MDWDRDLGDRKDMGVCVGNEVEILALAIDSE